MKQKNTLLIKSLILFTIVLISTQSQAYQISDHSLKGSLVKTFHVQCAEKKIALIRINPKENSICLEHQNTNEQRTCLKISDQDQKIIIHQLAKKACK